MFIEVLVISPRMHWQMSKNRDWHDHSARRVRGAITRTQCISSIRFGQICAFLGFTRANARVPHGLMGFTRANARVPHGLRGVSPVGLSWQCWTILTLMNCQKQRLSPRKLSKTESSDVCLCSFGKIFWRRSLMSTREFASCQKQSLMFLRENILTTIFNVRTWVY